MSKIKLTEGEPVPAAAVEQIKSLQLQLDDLRRTHGVSAKDECLWRAGLNSVDYGEIIVVADGLGGATVRQVDGNWPVDCMCEHEREFTRESDAIAFADSVTNDQFGDGDWEEAERLWDAPEPTGN